MQTRLPTLAIIVLGAAIISVVHSVRVGMPELSGTWPYEWTLAASLPLFVVQVFILRWIDTARSGNQDIKGFLIFFACVLLDGVFLSAIEKGVDRTVRDGLAWFPLNAISLIALSVPVVSLFALLLATIRIEADPNRNLIKLPAILLFVAASLSFAYWITTSHQRVVILRAVEDVKLYATDDLRWDNQIGALPAGAEAIVAYCIDTKSLITPVISMPDKPGILAQAGHGERRLRKETTGLFSRPRVLGCGDW